MGGDGLDGLGAFEEAGGVPADGQHGGDVDRAEGAGAADDLGDEGVGDVGRGDGEAVVGDAQADIGDHAEEAALLPFDGHVAADDHVLDGDAGVQADVRPFFQRGRGNDAELLISLSHSAPGMLLVVILNVVKDLGVGR